MGLSSSKQKTTTDAKTTEQGTTTPTNLPGLDQTFLDWTDRIGAFGNMDPTQFVAPAAPLQRMAWNNVNSLADWQPQARLGAEMVQAAGNRPAASTGPAALVAARGYQAPNLADPQGYAAARIGSPIGVKGQTYSTQPFGGATIAPTQDANAASLLDNFSAYSNPYTRDVINTSLSDFDQNAAQTRARQAAEAARGGAFGGSRYGIAQAQTEDNLARARASLDAQLRSQGFETAAGLSGQDAARRQDTSLFNAQNAAARAAEQAQLQQQAGLFSAGAANDASRFGAESNQTAELFNSGQDQSRLLAQAGLDTDAAKYAAGIGNDFALQRAQMGERAGQFNANLGSQADLSNQAAQNQFSLANAGFADAQLGRGLQAGLGLGDMANQYGAGVRSDLGLMGQLGDQQRGIEQQYALSPLAQLQAMGQLYGTTPYGLFSGQNVSTTGTQEGTNTTVSSPSLFQTMLSLGQMGANAYAAGRS